MKQFLIFKLDTPLTLKAKSMSVPQAEPVNFAYALIKAFDKCKVTMVGTEYWPIRIGRNVIQTIPFDIGTLLTYVERYKPTIIVWQGRTPFIVKSDVKIEMLSAEAYDYERVAMRVIWYQRVHEFLSTCDISMVPKYFVMTDTRLPFVDISKIFKGFRRLPKGFILLSQAYKVDEYLKHGRHDYRVQHAKDVSLSEYCYKFEQARYLPLHALPFICHSKKFNVDKKHNAYLFQTQSLTYYDEYRKLALSMQILNAIENYYSRVVVSSVKLIANEQKVFEKIVGFVPELLRNRCTLIQATQGYYRAIDELSEYFGSIIVSEDSYVKYGLCPNRFVEALAVGAVPLFDSKIFVNCDSILQSAVAAECMTNESMANERFYIADAMYNQLLNEIKNIITWVTK